ncbi:hypothetical protein, partial [Myxosarcina sp. GI1(2024)]
GGRQNHRKNNLALLHQHCHDQIHQGVYDKHQIVEKLDEVKVCAMIRINRIANTVGWSSG